MILQVKQLLHYKESIMEQRYYYKDSNNNYYSYKEEHNDLIPITEEEWNEHIASLTPKPLSQERIVYITKQNRIAELKRNLADTDYQAIKYAEGMIGENDYRPIKAQRQAWRDEINELEFSLA